MDRDGGFWVAWAGWGAGSTTYDTYIRRFNAGGTAATGEILASTTSRSLTQYIPDIGVALDGSGVVAWQEYSSNDDVRYRRWPDRRASAASSPRRS